MDRTDLIGDTVQFLEEVCIRLRYIPVLDFVSGEVWVLDCSTREERFHVRTEEYWLDAVLLLIAKLKASEEAS